MIQRLLKRVVQHRYVKRYLLEPHYFCAQKHGDVNVDYLSFLLKNMYRGYYLPNLEKCCDKDSVFSVANETDYLERWLEVLRVGSTEYVHLILDATNLALPGHQSEQQIRRYYELNQNLFIIRYLQYPMVYPDYLYDVSRQYVAVDSVLSEIRYCELGPGIPHGLFYLIFKRGRAAVQKIKSIEIIDYDLLYRDITLSLLQHLLPEATIIAKTSAAIDPPNLETEPNFFCGKDVFEHLHQPEKFLSAILATMAKESYLALDIEDHASDAYQHLSSKMSNLQALVKKNGYVLEKQLPMVKLYYRC
ncbi:MAG: hypothetical protein QNJ97_12780 [Myxococcota bacterium]|nr:hypothetical protein [Myxococcota bacterium]